MAQRFDGSCRFSWGVGWGVLLEGPARRSQPVPRLAAGGPIVARPAAAAVAPLAADQPVAAGPAREHVPARTAEQRVPAGTAADHVAATASTHAVVAAARHDD